MLIVHTYTYMEVKVKVMPGKNNKWRNEQQLMTAEAGGNQWNPNIISNCWVITDKEEDSGYEIIWGGAELLGETGKYVNELMCTKPSYDYTEIQLPLAITVLGNRRVKWVYAWMRVFMRLVTAEGKEKVSTWLQEKLWLILQISLAVHPVCFAYWSLTWDVGVLGIDS